jgi:hypothetical protein
MEMYGYPEEMGKGKKRLKKFKVEKFRCGAFIP